MPAPGRKDMGRRALATTVINLGLEVIFSKNS